ncbi:unnamed protein product [Cochlearia groenlandica]
MTILPSAPRFIFFFFLSSSQSRRHYPDLDRAVASSSRSLHRFIVSISPPFPVVDFVLPDLTVKLHPQSHRFDFIVKPYRFDFTVKPC